MPALSDYLAAVVRTASDVGLVTVSVVVFGSASLGGHSADSDVDLFVVVADDAPAARRRRLRTELAALEVARGLRRAHGGDGLLTRLIDGAGDALSSFVCTRADLLSGDPARVFGLSRTQGRLVDRIVLANIVASAVTACGENLLPAIALPALRRVDVVKAWLGLSGLTTVCALAYPLLPRATRHAMGALKRSVHSCHYVLARCAAPLDAEIAYFRRRLGPSHTLDELLALRAAYRPSFGFVVRAIAAIARLHVHAARTGAFRASA